MDMSRSVKKYGKIYRKILSKGKYPDPDRKQAAYEKRLADMYASENFARHNVYPTTNTKHIYAVIAMCLELKKFGLSDPEIIDEVNSGFSGRRNFYKYLIRCIDLLPNSYHIAEKWNISDHEKRIVDGSIHYDQFDVSEGRIEYNISKCVYVEMFETYGIRPLCKIFCMTDTTAYSSLEKHVEFIRYSDLSDGDCCHDVIMDKRRNRD